VKTITTWARGGTPEGDPAKAPAAKTFPPDGLPGATHALSADAAYKVVPSSKDEIRCFPADPKFDTDAWISGTNVVPGNNKVVHHVIVYVDPRRESFKKAGAAGSYPCFGGPGVANASLLVAWAPGVPPADYGADSAVRVAKGSGLVIQIHYHPATTEQADQTKVELRRRDQPPAWAAVVALNGNADSANPGPDGNPVKLLPGPNDPPAGPSFIIPAGMKGHTEAMEFVMPDKVGGNDLPDLRLAGVGSHMHWVGKNMVIGVERKSPQGEPAKECLLETPRYDFNWQRGYGYDASIDRLPILRAGDKLTFKCTYDNSMGNPYVVKALREKNLSAPVDVRLGEETLDEMCLGAFVLLFRNQ
jgi:hypothetical protein